MILKYNDHSLSLLMPNPIDIAWLIPLFPLVGGLCIGLLLFSFNRTMNRLSKPIAFILITCTSISAIISYFLLASEFSNEVIKEFSLVWIPFFTSKAIEIDFVIDKLISIVLSATCTLIIITMISYHFIMYRKEKYALYFIFISLASSSLLGLSITSAARDTMDRFIA